MRLFLILSAVITGLYACTAPRSAATLYNDDYNASKDQTTITLFPYGMVNLHGHWKKRNYDAVSRQHFFWGPDSALLAISINPANKFDFYKPGMGGMDFLKAYYQWESEYFQKNVAGSSRILKEVPDKPYLVWIFDRDPVKEYFLYGMKEQSVYNLYVSAGKWGEKKILEFLEKSFLD